MKLSSIFALLPLFASSLTLATLIAQPSLTKRADNITGPYYLKTKVLNGGDNSKDGLYVWAYHTGDTPSLHSLQALVAYIKQQTDHPEGAGLNDAVLGDKDLAVPAYLNNTYQMFNLTNNTPWTFFLPANTNYAGWELVYINGGYSTSGLFLNETGLQWLSYDSFGGWLACDWWHGIPQLFWKVNYVTYPLTTCAQVELITEEVDQ